MSQEIISEEIADISEIRKIRREKLAKLREENRDPFIETKYRRTAYTSEVKENFEEWDQKDVSMAGRLMSKRDMGKAFFADLMDDKGRIQLYVRVDDLGEAAFSDFKKWDIG
ncbi:MAG: lysine--tRNA ligase, partial [Clostridiales bacterium]|nr:lysine--tRNA ligase [Clostridiales bacterium]